MGRARFPAGEAREEPAAATAGRSSWPRSRWATPTRSSSTRRPTTWCARSGPAIEMDPRFPERTNVEFVRAEGPSELTMRVWERGVGETLACGTGACAAAVAGVRLGGLTSPVTVHLAGGDLEIAVDDDLEVTMTGPAAGDLPGRAVARPGARAGGALSARTVGAERLRRLPPYLFAQIEQKIAAKKAEGVDIISLGIGDPDTPTAGLVVDVMREQVGRPDTHQYPSNRGRQSYRDAVAEFYADPLRGRPSIRRPRSSRRWAPRRPSPTSTWPSWTRATSRWRATPATRSTPPARCWPARSRCRCRCWPSSASSPTSRRSRPTWPRAPG